MQEYTQPDAATISDDANLLQPLWELASEEPDRAVYASRQGDQFVDVTAEEFLSEVKRLTAGLIGLGIEAGDRVSIMSSTRYEFAVLQYAIMAVGAAMVPIYETDSSDQIEWVVTNSEVRAIFLETEELRREFDAVADRLDTCQHHFVIDDGGLEQLAAAGDDVDAADVDRRAKAVVADDTAVIIYTSGTTGKPKGCVITHGNWRWTTGQALAELDEELMSPDDSTLLFLPLAHSFAQLILLACLEARAKIGFATDIANLGDELPLFEPTFLLSVPRVFEKTYNRAVQQAQSQGPLQAKIFEFAEQVAADYSREQQAGGTMGLRTRLLHPVFDRLVYSKLRERLGGRLKYAVSGGAPLGRDLCHFFNGAGITILEGYGLTETCAPATVNRPEDVKIGTVGRPLPGVTVRIAEDNEVLIKGGNIFQGYLGNQQATAEVLDDDGWFATGDLGELDRDGYLSITGRKKEILVTAGGKNVAPAVLEERAKSHPLVSQIMVVGDDRPFIAAVVTIDEEEFPRWADKQGKRGESIADLTDDPELRAEIQEAIDHANEAVSRAESIREFRILPEDFSIDRDELTPTLKLKRRNVYDHYEDTITDIYS